MNEVAVNYLNGNLANIYTVNYNAFGDEKISGYNFSLVNEEAVKELATTDKSLLPTKKIDPKKDIAWNEKQINSQMLQGILQGENIPKMADRLMTVVGMNKTSAIRNARTMTTAAENKGRQDSFKKAQNDGVIMEREWVATRDERTRAWHADLDHVAVAIDEPWVNEYGEIMFPGDPTADPANVYNCRCSIRARVQGFKWNEEEAEEQEPEFKMVDGKDISDTWERRPDEFDFEIEDVINAQGFDGLPRVVDADDFDRYVQESNFIAQRGYTAPNQETLDSYQEQLYYGKWYVDCSKGGSLNGQGMNAIGNIGTSLSQSSIEFAKEYSAPSSGVGKVETFTVDKSAKIISSSDLGEILWEKLDNAKSREERNAIEKLSEDQGRFAALLGYDVLQVNQRGSDDKIFIILNRTKCIFKGE